MLAAAKAFVKIALKLKNTKQQEMQQDRIEKRAAVKERTAKAQEKRIDNIITSLKQTAA